MLTTLLISLVAVAVAVGGLALWVGFAAERTAGAILLLNLVVGFGAAYLPGELWSLGELVFDGACAFLILALTLRYASVWLGALLLLYSAQFALHAFYYVTARAHDVLHAIVADSIFLGIVAMVLVAALGAIRARRTPA